MTDKFLINNRAITTLNGAHNNTTTTINVNPGDGALFPSPGANEHFAFTIQKTDGTAEVCYCTSRSTDALTVVRGRETAYGSPSAQTYVGGEVVELRVTAGMLVEFLQNTVAETITGNKTFSGLVSFTGDDIQVGEGGTGRSTLTDGAILIGNAANAISMLAHAADTVLLGDGSGDPSFGKVNTARLNQVGGSEAVTQACMRDDSVGTAQIIDNNVTPAKLPAPTQVSYPTSMEVGYQTPSLSYVKVGEFKVRVGGNYRTFMRLARSSPQNAKGKIYKNGAAIGTERTQTSSGWGYWTQDFTFAANDLIQLYIKTTSAKNPATGYFSLGNDGYGIGRLSTLLKEGL